MKQFVWNDLVRVTVGEMTRADHFDYSKAMQPYLEVADVTEYMMATDDILIVHSPTKIEVQQDGRWQTVEGEATVGEGLDSFVLHARLTHDDVRRLPLSLFAQWSDAATAANPYIRNLFLSAINSATSTNGSSAPPSASAPSPAPKSRNSKATKTTGRVKSIPKI